MQATYSKADIAKLTEIETDDKSLEEIELAKLEKQDANDPLEAAIRDMGQD